MRIGLKKIKWFIYVGFLVGVLGGVCMQPAAYAQVPRPPELNVQFHRAQAAWKSGTSMLEAKTRVDRVLKARPGDMEARKLRAQVLMAMDRSEEALVDARWAVAFDPEDGEALLLLIEAARLSGNRELALEALEQAADHVTEDPTFHIRLSWNAQELEELDKAEAYARLALVQGDREDAAYYQLARVFILKEQIDDAATVLARGFRASLLDPVAVERDLVLVRAATHPLLAPWMQR